MKLNRIKYWIMIVVGVMRHEAFKYRFFKNTTTYSIHKFNPMIHPCVKRLILVSKLNPSYSAVSGAFYTLNCLLVWGEILRYNGLLGLMHKIHVVFKVVGSNHKIDFSPKINQ